MKVTLMTSEESFINNYGAALQGYALFRIISGMHHKVRIVRYKGGCFTKKSSSRYNEIKKTLRITLSIIYRKIVPRKPACNSATSLYETLMNKQRECFKAFQTDNLTFWNEERTTWNELKWHHPVSDAYVCGSDQIWNPYYKNGYNDPGYFLDFAPKNKKRIAYAPSFGCDDIPETAQHNLGYYLDKFDAVSVREPEGAQIIRKYTGKEVPVLVDPVLLLTKDEWFEIATTPLNVPPKYILCYCFMKNDVMKQSIEMLHKELNLPVISLPLPLSVVALDYPYEKRFDVGPSDFIGLVKNAALVCTDSFHATVFSMIMNTPFYTFPDTDAGKTGRNMNSRIRNVIAIADLRNRVINEVGDIDLNTALNVDFSRCEKNIAGLREYSLNWLREALSFKLPKHK